MGAPEDVGGVQGARRDGEEGRHPAVRLSRAEGPLLPALERPYTAAKIGGNQVLIDIDNLVDNAWNAEPVKQSVTAWVEIQTLYGDKAYFGLDHTQTQVKQLQNKLLFYPVGSWIENEMAKDTPKDFEYAIAPIPDVTAADKMPYGAIQVGVGENFFVSAKGKNPQGGLEYLRIMLSKEGRQGLHREDPEPHRGQRRGRGTGPHPRPQERGQGAGRRRPEHLHRRPFRGLVQGVVRLRHPQINVVMAGRITPEKFCQNMQKKADAIKKDPAVVKQTRSN